MSNLTVKPNLNQLVRLVDYFKTNNVPQEEAMMKFEDKELTQKYQHLLDAYSLAINPPDAEHAQYRREIARQLLTILGRPLFQSLNVHGNIKQLDSKNSAECIMKFESLYKDKKVFCYTPLLVLEPIIISEEAKDVNFLEPLEATSEFIQSHSNANVASTQGRVGSLGDYSYDNIREIVNNHDLVVYNCSYTLSSFVYDLLKFNSSPQKKPILFETPMNLGQNVSFEQILHHIKPQDKIFIDQWFTDAKIQADRNIIAQQINRMIAGRGLHVKGSGFDLINSPNLANFTLIDTTEGVNREPQSDILGYIEDAKKKPEYYRVKALTGNKNKSTPKYFRVSPRFSGATFCVVVNPQSVKSGFNKPVYRIKSFKDDSVTIFKLNSNKETYTLSTKFVLPLDGYGSKNLLDVDNVSNLTQGQMIQSLREETPFDKEFKRLTEQYKGADNIPKKEIDKLFRSEEQRGEEQEQQGGQTPPSPSPPPSPSLGTPVFNLSDMRGNPLNIRAPSEAESHISQLSQQLDEAHKQQQKELKQQNVKLDLIENSLNSQKQTSQRIADQSGKLLNTIQGTMGADVIAKIKKYAWNSCVLRNICQRDGQQLYQYVIN